MRVQNNRIEAYLSILVILASSLIVASCNTISSSTYHPLNDPYDEGPEIQQPLVRAAAKNQLDEVKRLIDAGAPINTVSMSGFTALSIAVRYEYTDVAVYLINAGANINVIDRFGFTPLEAAVTSAEQGENYMIVKALVKAGADPDLKRPGFLDSPRQYALDVDAQNLIKAMAEGEAEREKNR